VVTGQGKAACQEARKAGLVLKLIKMARSAAAKCNNRTPAENVQTAPSVRFMRSSYRVRANRRGQIAHESSLWDKKRDNEGGDLTHSGLDDVFIEASLIMIIEGPPIDSSSHTSCLKLLCDDKRRRENSVAPPGRKPFP
jgi:hypothetical protein